MQVSHDNLGQCESTFTLKNIMQSIVKRELNTYCLIIKWEITEYKTICFLLLKYWDWHQTWESTQNDNNYQRKWLFVQKTDTVASGDDEGLCKSDTQNDH